MKAKAFDINLFKRILKYTKPYKTVFYGVIAVSYTHLDVYKRQSTKMVCWLIQLV